MPEWFLLPFLPWYVAAWVLFTYIELSDILDGVLARSQGLVTELGKLLDPFSDVVSRLTYFVVFVSLGVLPAWIFLLLLYRELGITFMRSVLSGRGLVLAARGGGKIKAVLYAIAGGIGLLQWGFVKFELLEFSAAFQWVVLGIFLLALLASYVSLVDYLKVSFAFLKQKKNIAKLSE